MAKDVAVHTEGWRELRRDLRKFEPEIDKQLRKNVGAIIGSSVVAAASAAAPRRTGALAASYRPFVTQRGAGVRSKLPYAAVHEYGGTISPQGTPITIRRSAPITRAVERLTDRIVDAIGDAVEQAADATGWRK